MTATVAEPRKNQAVLGDSPLALHPDPAPVAEMLRDAGYTAEGLDKALGTTNAASITPMEIPMYLRRLQASPRLATLAQLFLLRTWATRADAAEALRPLSLEYLQALGLLEVNGDRVESPLSISPFDGLYFTCDKYRESLGDLAANHVTGVNPTSIVLAAITVRRPVESALDLGTGCGVQALLAARHARRVVATDMNRRALNVTAFNARLNGFQNVEVRHGSFFQPVEGEKFDLIATNPPYVISPESRYQFRDAGQRGDGVSRTVAQQLPKHLTEGGIGHQLANWVCEPEKDWGEPLRGWLAGAGVDTLALLYLIEEPLAYATKWIKPEYADNPAGFGPALDRWVGYFKDAGIRALATGSLTYRKRAGNNWFHGYLTPSQALAPCGHQLYRTFQIQDYLNSLPRPEALLERKLRLGGDHRLEQISAYRNGRYELTRSELKLNQPLAFSGTIDEAGIDLLAGCNGDNRLADLVARLAERIGKPPEEIAPSIAGLVRNLMLMGFLTPVELE